MTMAFSRSLRLLSSVFLFIIAVKDAENSQNLTQGSVSQRPPRRELNPKDCRNYFHCQSQLLKYDFECLSNPRQMFIDSRLDCKFGKNNDIRVCRPLPTTPPNPEPIISKCNYYSCLVPDCFCDENSILMKSVPPVRMFLPKDIPQMIIFTFSGPLNEMNVEPIIKLLNKAQKNPNECPIKATFFVPHENTSYYYVQKLYSQGHEIATQTVTNRPQGFWPNATYDEWVEDVIGMKQILKTFANVPGEDIVGLRVPFLESGDKNMLRMMYEYGMMYDSSVIRPPWLKHIPIWPYKVEDTTLLNNSDSLLDQLLPGIWEFTLNPYIGNTGKIQSCEIIDDCNLPNKPMVIDDFLRNNFLRHYTEYKVPFLLNFNANWMVDNNNALGVYLFIEYVQKTYSDIWFVTMQQAVEWLRKPVTAEQAKNFDAWECSTRIMRRCIKPLTCQLKMFDKAESDVRYMQICGKCPKTYPSLNNLNGIKETVQPNSFKDLVQKLFGILF